MNNKAGLSLVSPKSNTVSACEIAIALKVLTNAIKKQPGIDLAAFEQELQAGIKTLEAEYPNLKNLLI